MSARLLLLLLILLAFGLRLYRLDYQSLWTDEGFGVDLASLSAGQMLGMWQSWEPGTDEVVVSGVSENVIAEATDTHAPLHYFLLHFWTLLAGRTEFALRFLSVFFGLLTVPLLHAIGRRLLSRQVGVYAALFAALSPFYVAYAQEARMYTTALAFSALSVYLMARLISQSYSKAHVAGYIVSTTLALYTHYFTGLIVVFQNLAFLGWLIAGIARSRLQKHAGSDGLQRGPWRRTAVLWLLSQAAVLLLLLPWVNVLLRQSRFPRNEALAAPSASEFLSWYWQALNNATPTVPRELDVYLLAAATFAGALLLARWLLDRQARGSLNLLLLYLAVPLALTFAILQFQPMYHPRYLIAASPAYYLLLAASLEVLRKLQRLAPAITCGVVSLGLAYGVSNYYFDPQVAKDDGRAVASYLKSSSSIEDLIVLDYPEPIGYYYRGVAPYVFLTGEKAIAIPALDDLASGRQNIFHVTWWQSRSDPAGLISYLLSKQGVQTESRQFRGYRVDKYRMRDKLSQFATAMRNLDIDFDGLLELKAGAFQVAYGDELRGALRQGGQLAVALQWQLPRATRFAYKAFVNVKSTEGHVVGQADRALLKGQLSTNKWASGDTAETYHLVRLVPGTPPGDYVIEAGAYEPITRQPVRVIDRNKIPVGTTVALGKLRVERFPEGATLDTPTNAPASIRAIKLGIPTPTSLDVGAVRLLGYDLPGRTFRTRDTIPLTLLWQAADDVKKDYAFRLEAFANDQEVFRWPARRPQPYPTSSWIKGELARDWGQYLIPSRLPPGKYLLRGQVVELPAGVSVGTVDLGELEVRERARGTETPAGINRLAVQFGDAITLLGYTVQPARGIRPGKQLELTLYWRAAKELDRSFTVFTHVLDGSHRVSAQHDGLPASGDMPTTSWLSGEVVADKHVLLIDETAAPGTYALEVGLYDALNGNRLPARSSTTQLMGDAALIAKVEVQP